MPVFLDEDMMGRDDDTVGFPHLLLCMGFVVRTANDLWGVHLTETRASQPVFDVFWSYAKAKGLRASAVLDVHTSCNLGVRYSPTSDAARRSLWANEVSNFAKTMGWSGTAYLFDTSILAPRDGTYVQFDRVVGGARGVRIHYKRNEKTQPTGTAMVPSAGGTADVVAYDDYTKNLRAIHFPKTGIEVTTEGGLREVDYALRLSSQAVPL